MGAQEITSVGSTPYLQNPIDIVRMDGETVTFTVSQTWTSNCSVHWIATSYNTSATNQRCDKESSVIPDEIFVYKAFCVDKRATVNVVVYDTSFNTTDDPVVPSFCGAADEVGNKVAYTFSIPCECSTANDPVPTPAPTSLCAFQDLSFDDKSLVDGAYVSLQWKDFGLKIKAKTLIEGVTGGYMPNGYPRLFNTSQPIDGTGYGTANLAGDFGNVLIVQQTGANPTPKANELGGIITFEFATPVDEFVEIGLANIVNDVWIQVTDSDGAVRTFVVHALGPKTYKNVVIDVVSVAVVKVSMHGPSAITHIGICREDSKTPSPNSVVHVWPTESPSSAPSASISPSRAPSESPTRRPTKTPTKSPTKRPTKVPTKRPTKVPTKLPTKVPTKRPTKTPTKLPTKVPTKRPTKAPTKLPTKVPTKRPTKAPTKVPTKVPTKRPTKAPTKLPTKVPTKRPTKAPTKLPTKVPTKRPTKAPTKLPTKVPTKRPTKAPTKSPTKSPTLFPSSAPSMCVDDAKLLEKSVPDGAVGDYKSNPINILTKSGSSVIFEVKQTFVAKALGWLAVHYQPVDGSAASVCQSTEFLTNSSSTQKYSAKCYNGFAKVEVFAYDCTFKNISNVAVPSICNAWSNGEKTAAFHFSIPCDASPTGSLCDTYDCIPEARLVKKSVPSGAYGDVLKNPINIVHYGDDIVKFRVEQNWKDDDMSFISVQYKANASSIVCPASEGVTFGSSTPEYSAQCMNGYAVIDVFAYDCSFTGTPGSVTVPAVCKAWKGDGKTSHFQYSIPCQRDDVAYCVDEPLCVPEAALTSKSVVTGATGDYKSMPVTILRQGGSTVEFQVEQTWKDGAIGYIAVDYNPADQLKNNTCVSVEAVSKGFSTPPLTAMCVNGVAEIDVYGYDCTFTSVPNIDLKVPGSCQPFVDVGKKVHFHFAIPCLCAGSSSAVPITSIARNALTCTNDIVEDYESNGQIESWSYGTEYNDLPAYTTFLGRLGMNHPEVSKVFTIPSTATSVDVSFDMYDVVGSATTNEQFLVGIQGSYLDIQIFQANGSKKYYTDIAVTAKKLSGGKYNVLMTIPSKWYTNNGNKLPLTFKFVSSQLRYGIDNVRLHANCSIRRQLETPAEANDNEEDVAEAESATMFYCSTTDFPCGNDENMVHVCHYSTHTGYETHCIPEADSEILRFYQKDYCGPCVGSNVA